MLTKMCVPQKMSQKHDYENMLYWQKYVYHKKKTWKCDHEKYLIDQNICVTKYLYHEIWSYNVSCIVFKA